MSEYCELCGGCGNMPHPMDEYHRFLQNLQYAYEHLQEAKKIADKELPSILISLKHTMDSVDKLRKGSKRI